MAAARLQRHVDPDLQVTKVIHHDGGVPGPFHDPINVLSIDRGRYILGMHPLLLHRELPTVGVIAHHFDLVIVVTPAKKPLVTHVRQIRLGPFVRRRQKTLLHNRVLSNLEPPDTNDSQNYSERALLQLLLDAEMFPDFQTK